MKKYILPIIILIAFIVLIAYFYFNKFNFKDEIDYTANRTGKIGRASCRERV